MKQNKGFTLAELLIVVAVIAVLVAVAIPTFGSQLEKSRQATDQANLRSAYAAAKLAILNQDDSNSPLKAAKTADTYDYAFWCDVNDGTFTLTSESDSFNANTTPATQGKSQTGNLVNTATALPKEITYESGRPLPASGKGIVASFSFDWDNLVWTLSDITFKANGAPTKGLTVTIGNLSKTVDAEATSFTFKVSDLVSAVKLSGSPLSAGVTYDIAAISATVSEKTATMTKQEDKAADADLTVTIEAGFVGDIPVEITAKYTDTDDGSRLITKTVSARITVTNS